MKEGKIMKKFLATLLIVTMIMSLFTSVVMADSNISITLDKNYSDDTFAGTYLNITSDAVLSEGETVAYFLNGKLVETKDEAGKCAIPSVTGENIIQAKVMNGDDVVATSNEIKLNFKALTPVKTIRSDYFEYEALTPKNYYTYETTGNGYGHSIVYENGEDGNRVLKYNAKKNQEDGTTVTQTYLCFPETGISSTTQNVEHISFEYDIKLEKLSTNVRLFRIAGNWIPNASYDFTGSNINNEGEIGDVSLDLNEWYHVKVILDMTQRTYDLYVGGHQISADVKIPESFTTINLVDFPRALLKDDADYTTFYVDNVEINEFKRPEISLKVSAENTISGRNILLTASQSLLEENIRFVYNVNGVDSQPTDSLTYTAYAGEGDNIAYVKAIDEEGNAVLSSEPVTFKASPYQMNWVKTALLNNSWYQANVFAPFVLDNGADPNDEVFVKPVDLSATDSDYITTSGGYAYHFKIANTGNDYDQKIEGQTYKKDYLNVEAAAQGADIISLTWKTKVVSMDATDTGFGSVFYNNAAGQSKSFLPFIFTKDQTIKVATSLSPSASDAAHSIEIPAQFGEWYKYEVIFDGKSEMIYLIVNDMVCSSFPFDDVAGDTSKIPDIDKTRTNFYALFVLGFGGTGNGTRELYLADYEWYCSKSVSFFVAPVYNNNGQGIIEKSQIVYSSPLEIDLGVVNNDKDIMCFAAVLDTTDGVKELLCIDECKIEFADNDYIRYAKLSLDNLPEDIATSGKYEIKIMMWDNETLAPITSVIPFN